MNRKSVLPSALALVLATTGSTAMAYEFYFSTEKPSGDFHCGFESPYYLWYGSAYCVSPIYDDASWPSTDVGTKRGHEIRGEAEWGLGTHPGNLVLTATNIGLRPPRRGAR